MGSEIGNHSYTHLINPPTTTVTETTVGDTPAGSTEITLSALPAFAGVTVGMTVTGLNVGANTPVPGAAGEGGAVANTKSRRFPATRLLSVMSRGDTAPPMTGCSATYRPARLSPSGIPAENTNFLQTGTGAVTGSDGDPFTYDYEFNQSKLLEEQELGITIYGAAVPGANETYATDQNILPYFQSVAATATTSGYTGYVTGGWTGVGSGYPSAIGYMSPTDQGALYIAPNMTFDFTEVQYEGKTVAQAEADWAAQFNALTADAAGTPVVVLPIHDYGAAAWNTTTDTGTGSPYTTAMYTDFIAQAYADNYEFLTLEELAARTEAQQKASINYTTTGNTITATITPDPTAPDLGGMALDVVNGGTDVIQNVTNWYAYNAQELFLPKSGGTFTINLGTTQDDVTHIASLPMRGDLLSCTGDGLDLCFAMVGTGQVVIDLGGTGTAAPVVTGATIVSLIGDQLDLSLTGTGENDVSISLLAHVTAVAFSADTGSSSTDFITDVATQTISGTLSGPLGAGDVVQVSLDDGTTWLTATTAAAGTTFSLTGVTLTGSNTLIARVENSSGVFSTPLVQAYVLDQVPPAAPTTPDLLAASDSGASNTDNITKVVTPTFTGTAEAGSTVTLFDGATAIGSGVVTGGTWTIVTTASLANGVHSISATATDVAGNVSVVSSALSVTIDTIAPVAPSAPDMTAASDTGKSSTDNITSITTPVFTGTAEANSTVTLYDGTTVVGTGVAAAGKWTITASALAAGVHSIIATATDAAGNVSVASTVLAVTIESSIAPPSTPDLVAASDSGVSNTDNITKTVRPNFTGTAALGNSVTLYDGTTAIGTANANATTGVWTITAATLADGTHSITAKATDAAGNVSVASGALSVTIDTIAPAAPTVPDLTAASDSGVSNTDNITNVTKPTFAGTAGAGSTVTLYNGSASIGTAIAASTGDWSITSTTALANGVHSISAKATDAAGNVSVASGALSVTIDTVIATPTRPDLIAASDSGVSNTDNITKITAPTFTGTAATGSTVSLFDGTTLIGTNVATLGIWTITTPTLADGVHSITAHATDVAGNVSAASSALSVTIDTVAPGAPKFTGGTASMLSGTGEAVATVTILNGLATVGTATVGSGGNWSWQFAASSSVRTLTAVETDKAGNVSAKSGLALIGTNGPDTLTSTRKQRASDRRSRGGQVRFRPGLRQRRDRRFCRSRSSSRHHQLPREPGSQHLRKCNERHYAGWFGCRDQRRQQYAHTQQRQQSHADRG